MWAAVDNRGVDMQPIKDNNQWWILFFVAFSFICSYSSLNLFVGVVIGTFIETVFALLCVSLSSYLYVQSVLRFAKLYYS